MGKASRIKLIVAGLLVLSLLVIPLVGACAKPAPAPEKIVLKAIDAWKPNYWVTIKFREMLDEINKESKGQLEIQYVGGPEIVGAKDQLTACGEGTIDMFLSAHTYYAGMVPESGILGLPVVVWDFDNSAKLLMALKDDLDKLYQEKAKAKYMMTLSPLSMNIFTSQKPIRKIADMKGLKLRTMGGWDAAALKALGAAPTKVSSPEIYTAAQRGVIDGGSRPASAITEWKEQEVWNYMVTTPLDFLMGGNWWVSLDAFNRLPANLQKLLEDTAKEQQPDMVKYFKKEGERRVKELSELGVEMVDLDPGEADKWNSILADAAEAYFMEAAPDNAQALISKLKAAAGR